MSLDLLQQKFRSKAKNGKISQNQLKIILKHVKGVSQHDLNYLTDHYLTQIPDNQFTFQQSANILRKVNNDARKVSQGYHHPVSIFFYESLITVKSGRIAIERVTNQSAIDTTFNFGKILGQTYQKKLINAGQFGIINQKQESVTQKYSYYHWIQSTANHLIQEQQDNPQQFFRSIYQFNFNRALQILKYLQKHSQYKQILVFSPVINDLSQIDQQIRKQEILKNYFYQREKFQIEVKKQDQDIIIQKSHFFGQYLNVSNKINQFKQTLDFCVDYCKDMFSQLQNPYFKAAAIFLANNTDNKDSIIQQICFQQSLSVTQRFSFAKKFLCPNRFQQFKAKIREKAQNSCVLDNILLFGRSRESEIILQNYLDQTNDLQKVAIIALYLKFSSGRQTKGSIYDRFIKCYEALIELQSDKNYKLVFDKKCLQIQVEKRIRTPNKTFSFDCTNCKQSQMTAILLEKIKIDILKQPKFKGHQHFAKQFKQQIMNCVNCLQVLPRCCICLFPITVFNSYAEFALRKKKCQDLKRQIVYANKGEDVQSAVVWCPKCFHGGHYDHMKQWQESYKLVCPVADCKCKCSF